MLQQSRCPLCEWCSALLVPFTPDGDGASPPVNIISLDTGQFGEPHTTVSKQADNTLVSEAMRHADKGIYLLLGQASQYRFFHFGSIDTKDRVVLAIDVVRRFGRVQL